MLKHGRTVVAVTAAVVLGSVVPTQATVGMLKQARNAGVRVENCLDCHAAQHSKEVMEERSRGVGFPITNCQGCHAGKFPSKLSPAGYWLVEQKRLRGAKAVDGAWLTDYVSPQPGETRKK
jgi:type II secretory pathway pseudopilin PulG